jgi:hypothetical protein
MFMKRYATMLVPVFASLILMVAGAVWLNAQITNSIRAHVEHSFVIGDKTLPPGDYSFRIERGSDMGVMMVRNHQGDVVAQFNVRQSLDNRRPRHSELVFRRYGNTEFLSKVYEGGTQNGVAVTETSQQERQLVSEGQHGIEHTEDEP